MKSEIRELVRQLLLACGEDPDREGLRRTPARFEEAYRRVTRGYAQTLAEVVNGAVFEEPYDQMVVVKEIDFYSLCEHHLLPFYGVAHVGYIPNADGRIVGISKLARVVETIARRPQLQERMTTQIADAIYDGIKPDGVAVVIQAEHLCMIMRGINKPGSNVITSAIRGAFRRRAASKAEFLSLIQSK